MGEAQTGATPEQIERALWVIVRQFYKSDENCRRALDAGIHSPKNNMMTLKTAAEALVPVGYGIFRVEDVRAVVGLAESKWTQPDNVAIIKRLRDVCGE